MEAAAVDDLPVPPYRPLEPVLAEVKIQAHQRLAVHQAAFELAVQAQEQSLDEVLQEQGAALRAALLAHRPGFERPAAALAMFEKRTEEDEKLYTEWQHHQVKYHQEQRKYDKRYVRTGVNVLTGRGMVKRQVELEELKGKCSESKNSLLAQASNKEDYGDHLMVAVEEMQQKQQKMFKELQAIQAQTMKEAEKQRVASTEMRMRGVVQMQAQQRNLRDQLRLESAHERLRLVSISARAAEHKRALSLGAPAWLTAITPRPGTS